MQKKPQYALDEDDDLEEDAELLDSMEVEGVQNLRNLSRFMALQNNIRVDQVTAVTPLLKKEDIIRRDWAAWQALPRVDPRKKIALNYVQTVNSRSGECWLVQLLDDRKKSASHIKSRGPSLTVSKKICPSEAGAKEFGKIYSAVLERLPFEITNARSQNNTIYKAVAHINQSSHEIKHSIQRIWRYISKTSGRAQIRYRLLTEYLDEITGEIKNIQPSVAIPSTYLNIEVPDIPDFIEGQEFEEPAGFDQLSAKQQRKERHAFKAFNYIQSCLLGQISNEFAMQGYAEKLVSHFFKRKNIGQGPFDGKALFKVYQKKNEKPFGTHFEPTRAVKRTLSIIDEDDESHLTILPLIKVHSLSRNRSLRVAQILTETWQRTGDIMVTWKAGCRAADILNDESFEMTREELARCGCSSEQAQSQIHRCDICGDPTLCKDLWMHVATKAGRACTKCRDVSFEVVYKTAVRYFTKEAERLGLDDADLEQGLEELKDKLDSVYDSKTGEWTSTYTGRILSDQHNRGRHYQHTPTVEGIFPAYSRMGTPDANGKLQLMYHADAQNIGISELCLNLMKWVWPPGVLQIVADWLNNTSKGSDDAAELMSQMRQVAAVRSAMPLTQKRRLVKMSAEGIEELSARLRSCKSEKEPVKWDAHSQIKRRRSRVKPNYDRLFKLIASMETAANHKFGKGNIDDSPYPFGDEAPSDWSWETAWKMYEVRHRRMWLECNGKWETIDTAETLMLECLYQCSQPGCNAGEVLGLRSLLTVLLWSPLKFSVAHLHHGMQMRTGWAGMKPVDVSQYDSEHCNISIEAWITNLMKYCFLEEAYDEIVDVVKNLSLTKEIYDPDLVPETTGATDYGDYVRIAEKAMDDEDSDEEGMSDDWDDEGDEDWLYKDAGGEDSGDEEEGAGDDLDDDSDSDEA